MVAIVGARNCTTYGSDIARALGEEIAGSGIVVVSGLAYGIDAASHEGAVRSGKTVAVLAHGLDSLYPAKHRHLANEILETGGALISQFAPRVAALPARFLERNRIIAALSKVTIVVEAAARSGSLSTARFAIEEGREVFAVPGKVSDKRCEGSNKLLQAGASVLLSAEDVLANLGIVLSQSSATSKNQEPLGLNIFQERLLSTVMKDAPISIEQIGRQLKVTSAVINQEILVLEMGGYIRRLPGNFLEVPHTLLKNNGAGKQ